MNKKKIVKGETPVPEASHDFASTSQGVGKERFRCALKNSNANLAKTELSGKS